MAGKDGHPTEDRRQYLPSGRAVFVLKSIRLIIN
jgi:hypothetical protein